LLISENYSSYAKFTTMCVLKSFYIKKRFLIIAREKKFIQNLKNLFAQNKLNGQFGIIF
jgi:hypothetical protein